MNCLIKSYDELTKDELYEILKLRNEVFVVEQNCPYQDCDGKDLNSFHVIMYLNEKIIGYLRILFKGISYKEISIGRVVIDKSYRKYGYGYLLMNKAIEYILNELNENEIRISAQEYLQKFYESFGFVKSSEIYLEDDIPHIEMYYKNK